MTTETMTVTEEIKETLQALMNVLPDDQVPHINARVTLSKFGHVENRNGFSWLTMKGVELCNSLGIKKQG